MAPSSTSTPPHIPLPYLLFHLYIEPLLLIPGGLYLTLFSPGNFLVSTVPSPISSLYRLSSTSSSHMEVSPILHLLILNTAGLYMVLMITEAVVLRLARHDLRVWRAVVGAMVCCDVIHLAGLWVVGGSAFMLDPVGRWFVEDWVNTGILVSGLVIRIAFLVGWGIRESMDGGKAIGKRE